MPTSPKHPCIDCGRLIPTGRSRCEKCAQEASRAYEQARGSKKSRGYDWRWDKFSAAYKRAHPWCEGEECEEPARVVHHIVPLDKGGAKYDDGNLVALCNGCHNRIHGKGF